MRPACPIDGLALRERVLDPFGPGGDRRYRAASHDLVTDEPRDPPVLLAPAGAVLVLDGVFLHRDELAGCWALSVWLEVPIALSVARMAVRDGTSPDPDDPSVARYVEGQRLHLAACAPAERADLVVDHADLDGPTLSG